MTHYITARCLLFVVMTSVTIVQSQTAVLLLPVVGWVGSTVRLECHAVSHSGHNLWDVRLRWYRNQQLLANKPFEQSVKYASRHGLMEDDLRFQLHRNMLVVSDLMPGDGGDYSCVVNTRDDPVTQRPYKGRGLIIPSDRTNYSLILLDRSPAVDDVTNDDVIVQQNITTAAEPITQISRRHSTSHDRIDLGQTQQAQDVITPSTSSSEEEEDDEEEEESGGDVGGVMAPRFTEQMVDGVVLRHAAIGSPVSLDCHATGDPQPQFQWYFENETQPLQSDFDEDYAEWRLRISYSALHFTSVREYDTGDYTCVVSNSEGIIRRTFSLQPHPVMQMSPTIVRRPVNVTVSLGHSAVFRCEVSSSLHSAIGWEYSSELVVTSGRWHSVILHRHMMSRSRSNIKPSFITSTSSSVSPPPRDAGAVGETSARPTFDHREVHEGGRYRYLDFGRELSVLNVTEQDAGFYTCVAFNNMGYDYASAYLQVIPAEPANTLLSAKSSRPQSQWWLVLVAVLVACTFGGVAIALLWRRLRRERAAKRRALEQASSLRQIAKKVCVERHQWKTDRTDRTDELRTDSGVLVLPRVYIERSLRETDTSCTTDNAGGDSVDTEYEFCADRAWEVLRQQLKLGKQLGEGEFGRVVLAALTPPLPAAAAATYAASDTDTTTKNNNDNVNNNNNYQSMPAGQLAPTTVAVKMLKEGHTDADVVDLVSELELMKLIGRHQNIINLLGACTQDGPLLVLVEYAKYGNLRSYLRDRRPVSHYERPFDVQVPSLRQLACFAYQVARGMEYLSSKKCVHRDLAARNILVTDSLTLKIADFGLARDVRDSDYYRKVTDGRLPVKWMAPEALFERIYTSQSDVWSFGVLLWEIMSMGGAPYPSVPSVERLFTMLRNGLRMDPPPGCPSDMCDLMQFCWEYYPHRRPVFHELVEHIGKIMQQLSPLEYINLALPSIEEAAESHKTQQQKQQKQKQQQKHQLNHGYLNTN